MSSRAHSGVAAAGNAMIFFGTAASQGFFAAAGGFKGGEEGRNAGIGG
jgi:hypothetical protein